MMISSNLNYFLLGVFFLFLWHSINSVNATNDYSSYRPYPQCKPSEYIRYPKSVADVVAIVKYAKMNNLTVKAFGIRHSQSDIICTEGIPVDMTGLTSYKMNDDFTVTVGAGVTMREATQFLRQYNRAFKTTPAFGNITIGGAIGTGAHGSTIRYNASISSQVAKLTIVNGDGDIQEINDPEELKAFKMHLGLLGIVVDVTLNTAELYKVLAHNRVVSDDILTSGEVIQMAQNTDQLSLYWFPTFNEVVIANWTIVDANTPGTDTTNDHVPSTYDNFSLIATLIKEIAFSLTESTCAAANTVGYIILHLFEFFMEAALLYPIPDYVPIYATEQGAFSNPAVGWYDEMFAPICYDTPQGILGKACPWAHGANSITQLDNEFSLDLNRLPDFIKKVKEIVKATPTAFPMIGILIRFSDVSEIYMSTSYGRQSAHFEFYVWNRQDRYNRPSGSLAGYQTILQTLFNEFNARPHWGKSGLVYHNSDSLDKSLNETARQKFIDAMNKYDPNEVFINNFGRRLKRKGETVDSDPDANRCALLDYCFCTEDGHCGDTQACTNVQGYEYRVCKTKNEIAPITIDQIPLPSPDWLTTGIGPYLISTVPNLVKGVISNCTLTDAIGTIGSVPGLNPTENILQTVVTLADQLSKVNSPEQVAADLINGIASG